MPADILITHPDRERIKKILDQTFYSGKKTDQSVQNLECEINRAVTVDSRQIPEDIITMNSKVSLDLNDEDMEISLVYPEDADLDEMKISVFSPIGTAILGYREGNTIEWEVPSGISKIHIKKILYQPERAGDYHL